MGGHFLLSLGVEGGGKGQRIHESEVRQDDSYVVYLKDPSVVLVCFGVGILNDG